MSLYRNSAWFLKGMTEFTRSAFLSAAKHFVEKDLEVSMAGRVFMITGANSGIGRATAMAIAKRGGTVHMVCRNKDKAEEARADIVKESGNKEIYVHILDLSETRKVWEFAEAFKRKYKALNVLINNAGCIMSERDVNAEGLEKSFASNVMDVILLNPPPQITVSSGGMLVQKLRTGNLQTEIGRYDGTMVYAQHKVRGAGEREGGGAGGQEGGGVGGRGSRASHVTFCCVRHQIKCYLSHAPNTEGVDLTVKCLFMKIRVKKTTNSNTIQ
uniref:Dehydrogenase/reductase 12-like a n=1 Tax=Oncorhynchus kisutch TaxID=8019 RepID=A0A8C7HG25_ONCKI